MPPRPYSESMRISLAIYPFQNLLIRKNNSRYSEYYKDENLESTNIFVEYRYTLYSANEAQTSLVPMRCLKTNAMEEEEKEETDLLNKMERMAIEDN